jgi:hypothetical protein
LLESAASPPISSLLLPKHDADFYLVSDLEGHEWSHARVATPGQTLNFGGKGASGIQVSLLDPTGVPLPGTPSFTFYVTFAKSGNLSAAVESSADRVRLTNDQMEFIQGRADDESKGAGGKPDDNKGGKQSEIKNVFVDTHPSDIHPGIPAILAVAQLHDVSAGHAVFPSTAGGVMANIGFRPDPHG